MNCFVRTNQRRKWDCDVLRMLYVICFFVIIVNCFTSWSPVKNFLGPDLSPSLFLEVLPRPKASLEGNQSKKSQSYFPSKRMWLEITHCVEQKALQPCASTLSELRNLYLHHVNTWIRLNVINVFIVSLHCKAQCCFMLFSIVLSICDVYLKAQLGTRVKISYSSKLHV